MLRKFAVLFGACVLCQCKADDARAPASDSQEPRASPAPPASEPAAPAEAQEATKKEQAGDQPSDKDLESERPAAGAAAPAKSPVLPSPARDEKSRARPGVAAPPAEPSLGDQFALLSDAEAALKAADQQLERLYLVSGKASQLAENDDRCVRACAAFSSLERAAAGVCRLAGERDARCTKARGRVSHHQAKIAACSCGGD